ncbi:hypothetical protein GCM10025781_08820 [Kocuria gwangalliensis]|uniref:DUF6318 domain-containing protein n=1 Tax=Kocuria gwangalliensis TaxID=501592 RepID=A0ABP8WSY3_9MICC
MGDALKRSKFAASLAALALGLTLAGCGDTDGTDSDGMATAADGSASSSTSETGAGSSDSPASTPDPSASGDWWPEQPDKMATGQEFPNNYEPATLEHPARNVPKPVMPEEAKQETEAGAQAFLDYYGDATWYAFQSGDTGLVRELSSENCERCLSEFDEIDSVYGNGDWFVGGSEAVEVHSGSFLQRSTGEYTLPISVNSTGLKIIEKNKVTFEQEPFNESDSFDVTLVREGDSWIYVTASPRGEL